MGVDLPGVVSATGSSLCLEAVHLKTPMAITIMMISAMITGFLIKENIGD